MESPILSRLLKNKKAYQSIVEELKINVNTAISYILCVKCENKTLDISNKDIVVSWVDKYNGELQQETLKEIYLLEDNVMLLTEYDDAISLGLLDIEQQVCLAESIYSITNN